MQTTVITSTTFDKAAKRLYKKYKHLESGINILIDQLELNPLLGTRFRRQVL